MQRTRTLIAAMVVAALAVGLVGALALAGPPKTRLIIINGVPGTRVDVCVDGAEKISALRYGRATAIEVGNKKKVIRFAKTAAGPCRGGFLGKRVFDPPGSGWDLTLVVTRNAPKRVTTFANIFPDYEAGDSEIAFRHAADVGKAVIAFEVPGSPVPIEPGPLASPTPTPFPFAKGDQLSGSGDPSGELRNFRIDAEKASNGKHLATTRFIGAKRDKLLQVVLVGKKPRNTKLVVTKHPARSPSPVTGP